MLSNDIFSKSNKFIIASYFRRRKVSGSSTQTSQVLYMYMISLNNYTQLQATQDKHFSERRESNKVNLTLQLLQYHI